MELVVFISKAFPVIFAVLFGVVVFYGAWATSEHNKSLHQTSGFAADAIVRRVL